jgi:predicted GIY-YIG superfamily endonuclease
MPRKTIDYSKTGMYKIVCKDLSITHIYVGSTTDFIKRKSHHKSTCNNANDVAFSTNVYKIIRANGGWDWSIMR